MQEKQIEKTLRQTIQNQGGICLKLAYTLSGIPDRLVILPKGRHAFIELKSPNGHLRPIQQHRIKQLKELGHKVYIINHPNQIPGVLDAI